MTQRRLREYYLAWQTVVAQAIDGFVSSHDLLGKIQRHPTQHRGPVRNVPGPQPLDQPLESAAATATIKRQEVRACDVDAHTRFVHNLATEQMSGMARMFFRAAGAITEATGNTVDAGVKALNWDLILDMTEQMPLTFDDDGAPEFPYIVAHPEAVKNLGPMTPTQEQRQAAIIQRKKEEHAATKRTRRLHRSPSE